MAIGTTRATLEFKSELDGVPSKIELGRDPDGSVGLLLQVGLDWIQVPVGQSHMKIGKQAVAVIYLPNDPGLLDRTKLLEFLREAQRLLEGDA